MIQKEISEKELDKMIDASIKQPKGEKGGTGEKKGQKKEAKVTAKEKSTAAEKNDDKAPEDKLAREEAKKSDAGTKGPKEPKAKKEAKVAALKPVEGYNPWNILTYPHLTEKSMNLVERNNVLVFIVSMKATKAQVKEAVEKGFGARVVSVNIEITRKNQKKAYVRLAEGVLASDIATRLGMI